MMYGVVINPFFDWSGDRQVRVPYNETVIYEARQSLTELNHEIPRELRVPMQDCSSSHYRTPAKTGDYGH
jgi:pullulanase/glycogen debranching enzyme